MTPEERNHIVGKILNFFAEIGLSYLLGPVENGPVMPGLTIKEGAVVIDLQRLKYPGDLLHEAGHVATMPASGRHTLNGLLGKTSDMEQASEIIAQAWSYAACVYLELDPALVFHDAGYRGASENLIAAYKQPYAPGVPLLAYYSMTYSAQQAEPLGLDPFPAMISWINHTRLDENMNKCESNNTL